MGRKQDNFDDQYAFGLRRALTSETPENRALLEGRNGADASACRALSSAQQARVPLRHR
jgi:hypothetical protein